MKKKIQMLTYPFFENLGILPIVNCKFRDTPYFLYEKVQLVLCFEY